MTGPAGNGWAFCLQIGHGRIRDITFRRPLCEIHDSNYISCMGRKHINDESAIARFRAGTLDRIANVLSCSETLADFLREAVERELKRRERRGGKTAA